MKRLLRSNHESIATSKSSSDGIADGLIFKPLIKDECPSNEQGILRSQNTDAQLNDETCESCDTRITIESKETSVNTDELSLPTTATDFTITQENALAPTAGCDVIKKKGRPRLFLPRIIDKSSNKRHGPLKSVPVSSTELVSEAKKLKTAHLKSEPTTPLAGSPPLKKVKLSELESEAVGQVNKTDPFLVPLPKNIVSSTNDVTPFIKPNNPTASESLQRSKRIAKSVNNAQETSQSTSTKKQAGSAKRKCHYYGCMVTSYNSPESKFHRLPTDSTRASKWLICINQPSFLDLTPAQLKDRCVCSKHFNEDSYRSAAGHVLKKDATPIPFWETQNTSQSSEYAEAALLHDLNEDKIRVSVGETPSFNTFNTSAPTSSRTRVLQLQVQSNELSDSDDLITKRRRILSKNLNQNENVEASIVPDCHIQRIAFNSANKKECCRICAQGETELLGIFSTQGVDLHLPYKINTLLPIEVKKNDRLPVKVCKPCIQLLEVSFKLRETCIMADMTLNILFNEPSQEETDDKVLQEADIMDATGVCESQVPSTQKLQQKISIECDYLERQFIVNNKLDDMSRTHDKLKPLNCHHCSKKFQFKNSLRKHILSHISENVSSICVECGVVFQNCDKYLLHTKSSQHDTTCKLCFKNFSVSDLALHMSSQHLSVRNRRCDLCGHTFFSVSDLCEHKALHSIYLYDCYICGSIFKFKDRLHYHMQQHREFNKFQCPVVTCRKIKDKTKDFIEHCETHTENDFPAIKLSEEVCDKKEMLFCAYCEKSFRYLPLYLNHLQIHGPIEKLLVTCNICCESFVNEMGLTQHLASHPEAFDFHCHHCKQLFVTDEQRNVHEDLVHSIEFQCELCFDTFYNELIFIRHRMHQHSNDFMKKSRNCEKSFMLKRDPSNNTTNFECQVCSQYFIGSVEFEKHCLMHKDEKIVYVCDKCQFESQNRTEVEQHVDAHESE